MRNLDNEAILGIYLLQIITNEIRLKEERRQSHG